MIYNKSIYNQNNGTVVFLKIQFDTILNYNTIPIGDLKNYRNKIDVSGQRVFIDAVYRPRAIKPQVLSAHFVVTWHVRDLVNMFTVDDTDINIKSNAYKELQNMYSKIVSGRPRDFHGKSSTLQ